MRTYKDFITEASQEMWTVTVTKAVNGLKKGESVEVKARIPSEAMKKAAKKWDEDFISISKYLDANKSN